jgi:methyl acetate hydrolase
MKRERRLRLTGSGRLKGRAMPNGLRSAADAILRRVTTGHPRLPGVAAIVTDRAGTIYAGAAGTRVIGREADMTTDTVCAIFSTTKAITATACLQLAEDGRLDLDAPARAYAPAIGRVQVIEGFDADGRPKLRAPRREITTRMLLLHMAGFGYDYRNETYARLAREHGQPSVATATRASIETPLLFDPGEAWEYGSGMDWAGQVVEGITGRRLGEAFSRIFAPLGMADTAFTMRPDMRARLARVHQRAADGSLEPLDLVLPQDPELHMGGHGLYSTPLDYAKFIRMWLNDGAGPGGRVLRPETVAMAARSGLGGMKIAPPRTTNPSLALDAELFPGLPTSWGLGFMINEEEAPTGRPAGSLGWAGLANLFFWIDRHNGIGGFWASQVFPYGDQAAFGGYLDFEAAVYDGLALRR